MNRERIPLAEYEKLADTWKPGERPARAWEACMTFNGSWGYMPISPDWRPVREVVGLLNAATAGGGNLLLNIGPAPTARCRPKQWSA